MAKIIYKKDDMTISVDTAMRWFCWHELIAAMEKDRGTLDRAVDETPQDCIDWEMGVLKRYLELSTDDLIV